MTYPSLFDTTPYERKPGERKLIRDLPTEEQPLTRISYLGPESITNAELLACILQTKDAVDLSQEIIATAGGLVQLTNVSAIELASVKGIGPKQANRIRAAIELGRRVITAPIDKKVKITSPATAAELLMPIMGTLEQEHIVTMLLNTRNQVLSIPTLYIGSLNTSAIRIAEVFIHAIRNSAAAIIMAHNHPSGDPSPSPEDINVTRLIKKAGDLLDIELLDHLIVTRQRFVSLKERGFMDG